jgi:Delta-aminolevulinic acid dehydratase
LRGSPRIKSEFKVPFCAYQVAGEYSMKKESINKGGLNEKVVRESLLSFKRAGAKGILTYFALEAAEKLKNE